MAPQKIIQTIIGDDNDLAEFLLEGEDDYISLQEAIRMASSGQIANVVVCSPKKGKPYLRAKADNTERNNLRNLAIKRSCGPEIGRSLVNTLHRVKQTFEKPASKGGWSNNRKADACNTLDRFASWGGVNAANAWDISPLYDAATDNPPLLINYPECAKLKGCKNTVMVFGQCHKAPIVNYVLFGFLWNLCRTGYPLSVLKNTAGYRTWEDRRYPPKNKGGVLPVPPQAPKIYREEYYTLDHALGWTSDYKAFIHTEDRPMALEWVATGFNFSSWIKSVRSYTPRDERYQSCGRCSVTLKSYDDFFDVKWGQETIT